MTLYLMIIPNSGIRLTRTETQRADSWPVQFAKQKADPDFYARDDAGNQTHASKAGQVHIEDSYL